MVGLSDADVLQFVPGGLDAVEAAVMRGLSIGLNFLGNAAGEVGSKARAKQPKTYTAAPVIAGGDALMARVNKRQAL